MRQKVLGLQIVVEAPEYDSEGKVIEMDSNEDSHDDRLDGVFNHHLLEEEFLNAQPYTGDTYFSDEELPVEHRH
jgi:hypothetical protein